MNVLTIIFFSLMGCVSSDDSRSISKIEIMAVDFELETFVSVSCDHFESVFEKEMKVIEITEQEKFNKFNQLVKDLISDEDNYVPDVRAKVIVYYDNDDKEVLCASNLGVLFNNKSMLQSVQVVTFIKENTLK